MARGLKTTCVHAFGLPRFHKFATFRCAAEQSGSVVGAGASTSTRTGGRATMMRAFLLAVLTSGHFVPAAARVTHSVAREDAVGHAAARPKALPLSDLARPSHHFPTSQPVPGPVITPGATLQATVDQAVAAGARELRVPQAVYVFNASSLVISGAKDLTIVFEPGLSERQ